MPQIEISDEAEAYLDAVREELPSEGADPLTYSEAIEWLRYRSWNAAHGGGRPTLDADDGHGGRPDT